jgi:hypothetical protein
LLSNAFEGLSFLACKEQYEATGNIIYPNRHHPPLGCDCCFFVFFFSLSLSLGSAMGLAQILHCGWQQSDSFEHCCQCTENITPDNLIVINEVLSTTQYLLVFSQYLGGDERKFNFG